MAVFHRVKDADRAGRTLVAIGDVAGRFAFVADPPGHRQPHCEQKQTCPVAPVPQSGLPAHAPHIWPLHNAVAQSFRLEQVLPRAQRGHVPPQSTSLSVPSLTPFWQDGAGAMAWVAWVALCLLALLTHVFFCLPDFLLQLLSGLCAAASSWVPEESVGKGAAEGQHQRLARRGASDNQRAGECCQSGSASML